MLLEHSPVHVAYLRSHNDRRAIGPVIRPVKVSIIYDSRGQYASKSGFRPSLAA
ncbi:MAG: hypothetical protein ACI8UP_004491 [Porticoccaceae bacterium]